MTLAAVEETRLSLDEGIRPPPRAFCGLNNGPAPAAVDDVLVLYDGSMGFFFFESLNTTNHELSTEQLPKWFHDFSDHDCPRQGLRLQPPSGQAVVVDRRAACAGAARHLALGAPIVSEPKIVAGRIRCVHGWRLAERADQQRARKPHLRFSKCPSSALLGASEPPAFWCDRRHKVAQSACVTSEKVEKLERKSQHMSTCQEFVSLLGKHPIIVCYCCAPSRTHPVCLSLTHCLPVSLQ